MKVVDSSGWLEYFSDGPNAKHFARAFSKPKQLVVPTISIYEVYKSLLRQKGESIALEISSVMRQGQVVDLDTSLAFEAAELGLIHQLPLADSIILCTAQKYDAELWTQDKDFKGLPGVRYFSKN